MNCERMSDLIIKTLPTNVRLILLQISTQLFAFFELTIIMFINWPNDESSHFYQG